MGMSQNQVQRVSCKCEDPDCERPNCKFDHYKRRMGKPKKYCPECSFRRMRAGQKQRRIELTKKVTKKVVAKAKEPIESVETQSVEPESQETVEVQGPSSSLQDYLAALLYFEDKGTGLVCSFEMLPKVQAQVYVVQAGKVLVMLDKLNIKLVPQGDPRLSPDIRLRTVEHVEGVIIDFMANLNVRKAGKNKTKQKLINPLFFPAGELAYRIVDAPYEPKG